MGAIPEVDPDEVLETKPFKFVTGGYDARFPQQNQTKHCWQNYVDYYKCTTAKGEDFRPCKQFYHSFRSLCPKAWTDRWDGQREAGNFPVHLDK
ncbi:Cytochrome c oxidase, subunit VIb [Penicillium expansum]|nr:Cytochrome c oxidase, subunit VIb [Penicillium expansum]